MRNYGGDCKTLDNSIFCEIEEEKNPIIKLGIISQIKR